MLPERIIRAAACESRELEPEVSQGRVSSVLNETGPAKTLSEAMIDVRPSQAIRTGALRLADRCRPTRVQGHSVAAVYLLSQVPRPGRMATSQLPGFMYQTHHRRES